MFRTPKTDNAFRTHQAPFKKRELKKLLDTDKLKDVKKRILKAKGASPGRIKAEFGSKMSRGGEADVFDLTTEMEVNE